MPEIREGVDGLTGLIVAGGKSTRFGSDKASALLAGQPMLQWVSQGLARVCSALVVVRAKGQQLPAVDVPVPVAVVDDQHEAKGPLAGLAAGFSAIPQGYCFATSCDAPLVRGELIEYLASVAPGHDIVCPYVEGFLQPLMAIYRTETCRPVFESCIEREILKITSAFGGLNMRIVREPEIRTIDPELESFRNANRSETLAEIEELLRQRV